VSHRQRLTVRPTLVEDIPDIIELSRVVYPGSRPWREDQLAGHLAIFPEGQFVARDTASGTLLGMAASLILRWDDYDPQQSWRDFTQLGTFANHDPAGGRTLYGAEVMVDPAARRRGVGSRLYGAREALVQRLGLRRIRAASRLRGYGAVAHRMTAREWVDRVAAGRRSDPTLSFQLRRGFRVLDVVPGYLANDPESLGWAAVIEWLNPDLPPEP